MSPNVSFAALPEVPVPCPSHGPEASPHDPESTVSFNREFQVVGAEQVPSGFRTPFPIVQGELPSKDRLESAAVQNPPVVLPTEVRARPHVCFGLPSDASPSALEQVEVEDDDTDSVTSNPPVVDKTLVRLANFIHESYPESRLLSAPPLAQRCGFESLFAISDPPELTRPRFRLYPRVANIIQATRDRAANLAKGTKPLSSILPKKRRLQSVADEPEFLVLLPLKS